MLSDAGLRVSEVTQLHWRDVLDAEDDAGLWYIERSKTDQEGEGAYVSITPETLEVLKQLRTRGPGYRDDPSGCSTADAADSQSLEVTADAGEVHLINDS